MEKIGEPVAASLVVHDVQAGIDFTNKIGYPIVLRPAYTLGGSGGGIAYNEEDLVEILRTDSVFPASARYLLKDASRAGKKSSTK